MGQALRKLFDSFFGVKEMRVVMLGLDSAGKTTILYRMHLGEVLSTVPTVGFNVEKVQYKNVAFTVWDVGGQEKLRPLWRMYFSNTDALVYVVDSLDRERIGDAHHEFQGIIKDPLMANCVILVFANKQDLKGAMSAEEVCRGLGMYELKNRIWHIQGTCALKGDGIYDGRCSSFSPAKPGNSASKPSCFTCTESECRHAERLLHTSKRVRGELQCSVADASIGIPNGFPSWAPCRPVKE